ncbi:urea carboxylase-associated family protein, partial [Candidatus Pelagibacter sp.]|nr:urea carboxylase-associated family protein [Candidatus Pelagibacter sp.]
MTSYKKITIQAKDAQAFDVAAGQRIRICTPKGYQAADFFAYNANRIDEWLSPPHTWIASTSVKPRPGDIFLSRFRRPMLKMIEDGGDGIHDMLLPACDQFRYEFFGFKGPHPSCSDNLMNVMRRRGYEINVIPQPINFFTNTNVQKNGSLLAPKN